MQHHNSHPSPRGLYPACLSSYLSSTRRRRRRSRGEKKIDVEKEAGDDEIRTASPCRA
jgi:hypothetical protein